MKIKFYLPVILLTAILLSSCGSISITQKRYSRGFHIGYLRVEDAPQKVAKAPRIKKQSTVTIAESSKSTSAITEEAPVTETAAVSQVSKSGASEVGIPVFKLKHNKRNSVRLLLENEEAQITKKLTRKAGKVNWFKVPTINESDAAQSVQRSKSQWTALLLCFFFGFGGIHRFYLGYKWQSWVQAFTFGGLGIWSYIDFWRILFGDLQPYDRDYTETI